MTSTLVYYGLRRIVREVSSLDQVSLEVLRAGDKVEIVFSSNNGFEGSGVLAEDPATGKFAPNAYLVLITKVHVEDKGPFTLEHLEPYSEGNVYPFTPTAIWR